MAVLALALPFLILLRGSTWLYATGRLSPWTALLAGAGATILIISAYAALASRRIRGRLPPPRPVLQAVGLLVVAYCAHALVFFSGDHAKNDAVRAEYRSLHPLLRMAVATLVIMDGELLMTDAARAPDDYSAMGLPVHATSLHFEQETGWAHAVDLRTRGRSDLRNALTRAYFSALGFRTLRHGGTADHLHVSLPVPLAPPDP